MKVLVTGATGYIGRRVAAALLEAGHEVTALVRSTSNISALADGVHAVEGDILDTESLQDAVVGQDAAMHFAAYFDFYATDEKLLYRTNVDGTRNLMNACADASVQRLLYCSTTEVIGPVRFPPGNEDTELSPQFEYARSKIKAEEAIREISKNRGLDHIILRASGVVGEGDMYVGFDIVEAVATGAAPFIPDGETKINMFIHVDDVASAFVAALTSQAAANETIILCPDEAVSWIELFDELAEHTGGKAPRPGLPMILARLGMAVLSRFKGRGRKTFLWHTESIKAVGQCRWYLNDKAKRLLGWKPEFTLIEAFKRAADWYFEQGLLERK